MINELYFGPINSDESQKIFSNPSVDELWSLLRTGPVRGLLGYDNDVYIWHEDNAGHYTISNDNNIRPRIAFYAMRPSEYDTDLKGAPFIITISRFTTPEENRKGALKELFSHPKIHKMIGQMDFQKVLEASLHYSPNDNHNAAARNIKYIGPTRTYPSNRNQRLIDKGVIIPGQKWWAPQSEAISFKKWLNT